MESIVVFKLCPNKKFGHLVDHTKYVRNSETWKIHGWHVKAGHQNLIESHSLSYYVNIINVLSLFWLVAKVTLNGQSYPNLL